MVLKEAVEDFLTQQRIAVAGVSRSSGQAANLVYKRLRQRGYTVFAVNPNAESVEGDPCYPDLKSIPETIDGVVVATTPTVAEKIVEDCAELGIQRVWLHRSFGEGSVSPKAVASCQERNILAIAGGCPLMFGKTADLPHKCMRGMLKLTGGLPREA